MSSPQDKTAGYEASAASSTGPGAARETAARPEAGYPEGSYRGAGYPEAGYQRGAAGYGGGGMAETGFTVLAATLMILSGLLGFFEGLVAIIKQSFFVTLPNYTFQFSVHGWGWVHLILGAVIFAAGVCVLLGQTWAKVLGIVLAVFSGIANFLFVPYYPVWAIVVIAMDVFIIWALASSIGRHQAA
jgi:hypothetical protein